MGHGSDKLYITHSEWMDGGHSSAAGAKSRATNGAFARLPFDCCALTLKAFETPVCTDSGTIYELLAIIPFIRLHGTDPVTGKKLSSGDLIKLNFFKNGDDEFFDPVTFKVFNEHTPLVAIKTSGNVYSRETIDRLNIKPGHWHDLMTDEKFTRADLITIQVRTFLSLRQVNPAHILAQLTKDPLNLQGRDLSQFDYIKRDLKIDDDSANGSLAGINVAATGVGSILKKVSEKNKAANSEPAPVAKAKAPSAPITSASLKAPVPYNASVVSSGRAAASLTSTSAAISTTIENALWDEEDLMFEAITAKGDKAFVRLVTNFGNLNCELYCDKAPKTCYNFLKLAADDKYKDTIFHRLIPGFMLQGGDPTGTGKGGESFWGKSFEDEFPRNHPKHEDRGTLAMANSGPNSNKSQFYITFRATPHLDAKHTVFGRLVGGDDVLSKIERVPVDATTNRPLKPVVLKDVAIFQDPFDAYRKRLEKRLNREEEERQGAGEKARKKAEREQDRTTWFGTNLAEKEKLQKDAEVGRLGLGGVKGGVGKYVAAPQQAEAKRKEAPLQGGPPPKKKKPAGGFGEFSGW
ncbi:peptidyl-prolyl cis-trans isomerase-like 2, partial [Phenoliferia sp. Uapishka_3]